MFHRANNWDLPVHRRREQTRPGRKVISVPVSFFGSEEESVIQKAAPLKKQRIDRVTAAVIVQKVVRGFLARKSVRLVRHLEVEVGIIEKRVEELKGFGGGGEKERLSVGEMLMNVLFRLDSVRGARGYRKKVVRKVIRIQETLDSVANSFGDVEQQLNDSVLKDATLADARAMEDEKDEPLGNSSDPKASKEEVVDSKVPEEEKLKFVTDPTPDAAMEGEKDERLCDSEGEFDDCLDDYQALEREEGKTNDDSLKSWRIIEEIPKYLCSSDKFIGGLTKTEDEHDSSAATDVRAHTDNLEQSGSGLVLESAVEDSFGTDDHEKGVRDVLMSVVEENKKLREVVEELLDKNSLQCMMLHDLSLRVDDLENKMETFGKKKKRRQCVRKSSSTPFKKNCNCKL